MNLIRDRLVPIVVILTLLILVVARTLLVMDVVGDNSRISEPLRAETEFAIYSQSVPEFAAPLREPTQFWNPGRAALEKASATLTSIGEFWITGYDPFCAHCVGQWINTTASGSAPIPGRTAATYHTIPFGTELYIVGLGVVMVDNRGRGLGPRNVDIAMGSHAESYAITGRYDVYIIEWPESADSAETDPEYNMFVCDNFMFSSLEGKTK